MLCYAILIYKAFDLGNGLMSEYVQFSLVRDAALLQGSNEEDKRKLIWLLWLLSRPVCHFSRSCHTVTGSGKKLHIVTTFINYC